MIIFFSQRLLRSAIIIALTWLAGCAGMDQYLPADAPVGLPLVDYMGDAGLGFDIKGPFGHLHSVIGVAREMAVLGLPITVLIDPENDQLRCAGGALGREPLVLADAQALAVADRRRPGDPPELVANAALAGRQLGWQPQHSSLENITRTAWLWHQAEREKAPDRAPDSTAEA